MNIFYSIFRKKMVREVFARRLCKVISAESRKKFPRWGVGVPTPDFGGKAYYFARLLPKAA